MSTVFFKLNKIQDKEIEGLMKQEGYSSKAEFFRFLVKFFKYQKPQEIDPIEKASNELGTILRILDKQNKLSYDLDKKGGVKK